jgi:hypothetical protein
MHESGDLHSALHFVIGRISEEADRSGPPLDDDEKHFVLHLPARPTNPTLDHTWSEQSTSSWPIPLRDLMFERFCKLAKNAHKHDLTFYSNAAKRWNFAAAILQSHHHPMSWLLNWAGIRVTEARVSDRFLLVLTALVLVTLLLGGILVLAGVAEGQTEIWKWIDWIAGAIGLAAVAVAVYLFTKRMEKRQQQNIVERYRCDLRLSD